MPLRPRLYEQSATIASGAWWNFEPYKLCAEECPPKVTLKSAKLYGGPTYPNANDTAPSFFVPFETVDILGYFMPKADLEDGDVRQVCATPVCTDESVRLGARARRCPASRRRRRPASSRGRCARRAPTRTSALRRPHP